MLKTLAAVAALALVPTIASASTVMSFECEVTRVTPPEKNDYNPVVNTTLSTVYVGNRLTGFAVEHGTIATSGSGRVTAPLAGLGNLCVTPA